MNRIYIFLFSLIISFQVFSLDLTKVYKASGPDTIFNNSLWYINQDSIYIAKKINNGWEILAAKGEFKENKIIVSKNFRCLSIIDGKSPSAQKAFSWSKNLTKNSIRLADDNTLTIGNNIYSLTPTLDYIYIVYEKDGASLFNFLTESTIGAKIVDCKNIEPFSNEGISVFKVSNGLCGLVNFKGEIVEPANFLEIDDHTTGKPFRFVAEVTKQYTNYYYQLSQNGKKVQYEYSSSIKAKIGYFFPDGKKLTDDLFDYGNACDDHGIIFVMNNNFISAFDSTGKQLPNADWYYVTVYPNFFEGRKNNNHIFYKRNGSMLFPDIFDYCFYSQDKENKFFFVKKDTLHGVFDDSGKFIFSLSYSNIQFSEDKFLLFKNGISWFANKKGEILLGRKFEDARPFKRFNEYQYAWVMENNKWGTIDSSGNYLIKNQFQDFDDFNRMDFTTVKKNGRWGAVSFNDKEIIPFKYDSLIIAEDKLFYGFLQNGKWGLANLNTHKIIQTPKFTYLSKYLNYADALSGSYFLDEKGNFYPIGNGGDIYDMAVASEENEHKKSSFLIMLRVPYYRFFIDSK